MFKKSYFRVVWSLFLIVFVCSNTVFVVAGPKEEIAKIDKTVAELRTENKKQGTNVSKMKNILGGLYKPGAAIYRPDKLDPQGKAGTGVVGTGKNLSKGAKDATNNFESVFNPQQYTGGAFFLNEIAGEKNKLHAEYRKKHGLSKDQPLSPAATKFTYDMAVSRAHLKTEIRRSGEFIGRNRVTISQLVAKRRELLEKLTAKEREDYVRKKEIANKEKVEKDKLAANREKEEGSDAEPAAGSEKKQKEEKKRAFDDSNLRASFAKFEGLIDQQTAMNKSVSNACNSLPSRDKIKASADKLLQTPFKDIPLNIDLLRQEKVLRDRLLAILREIESLEGATLGDVDTACRAVGAGAPQLDPIKAAAARTQSAGEKAKALRAMAKKIHAKLIASHAKKAGVPGFDYSNFLEAQEKDVERKCLRISSRAQGALWRNKNQNKRTEVDKAAAVAKSHLQSAKSAKFEHADVYQHKFNRYAQFKKDDVANAKSFSDCDNRVKFSSEQCRSMRSRFRARSNAQQKKQKGLVDGIIANRDAQLATANRAMWRIDRLAARVYTAVIATNSCVADAESKAKQPDPKRTAEAAGLADLSGLSCDVAEIDRRISQLQSPKFKDVAGISQYIQNLINKRSPIQAAHARFNAGKTQFDAGDPKSALSELRAARAEIAKLGGVPSCPKLSGRIDKGEAQSQQLIDILTSSATALNTCKIADIRAALRKIGGKSKPQRLAKLKSRMLQQWKVLRIVGEARAAYNAKQYEKSLALIRKARAAKIGAGGDCPVILQRIDNATAAVQRKQEENGAEARVTAAARSCDSVTLKSFVPGYGGITKALKARADDAIQVCRAKEEDRLAEGKAEEQARRVAHCFNNYGEGYTPSSDGSVCIPNRTIANELCRKANKGRGWKADKYIGNGSYSCKQGRRQRVAAARADCRAQARSNRNKTYAFTKMYKNGTYECYTCGRGERYRKGKCRSKNRRTRTVYTCPKGYYLRGRTCYSRNNNNAAAAAAAAAVIGAIIGSGRGGGGGSSNCRANPMAPNC